MIKATPLPPSVPAWHVTGQFYLLRFRRRQVSPYYSYLLLVCYNWKDSEQRNEVRLVTTRRAINFHHVDYQLLFTAFSNTFHTLAMNVPCFGNVDTSRCSVSKELTN